MASTTGSVLETRPLKVILFAYSRGMVGSRPIEQACRENVVFMALSGDSAPHFTTIAGFIRELKDAAIDKFEAIIGQVDVVGTGFDECHVAASVLFCAQPYQGKLLCAVVYTHDRPAQTNLLCHPQ